MKEKWLWAAAPTVIIAIIVVIVMIIPQKKQNVVVNSTTMHVMSNESNDYVTHEKNTSMEIVTESVISTENVTTKETAEKITEEFTAGEDTTAKRETTIFYETVTKKTEEKTTKETTTKEEEATTEDNYEPEELKSLSQQIFKDFKHQTTNTVWNGNTTAKVMHPDQLLYLNSLGERWYEGDVSVAQVKAMALNESPIKTNEDMYNLTGFYQEFIGDEALFKVVDADAAKISFNGKRQEITESVLWNALCDVGESSATANFLFVRACYDERSDVTYVYYLDCKFQWINNNFVMEGES